MPKQANDEEGQDIREQANFAASVSSNHLSSSSTYSPVTFPSDSNTFSPSVASIPNYDGSQERMNSNAQRCTDTRSHAILQRHDLDVQSPKLVNRAASSSSCEGGQSRANNRVSSSTSPSRPESFPSSSKGLSPSKARFSNNGESQERMNSNAQCCTDIRGHALLQRRDLDVQSSKQVNIAPSCSSCDGGQSRADNRVSSPTKTSHPVPLPSSSEGFLPSIASNLNHDESQKRMNATPHRHAVNNSHDVIERRDLDVQLPIQQVNKAASASLSEGGQSRANNRSSSTSPSHPIPVPSSLEGLSPSIGSNPKSDGSEKRMNASVQRHMVRKNHAVLERHNLGVHFPKQVRVASSSSCEGGQSIAINCVSSSTSPSHPAPLTSSSEGLLPAITSNINCDGSEKQMNATVKSHTVTDSHEILEKDDLGVQSPKQVNSAVSSSSREGGQLNNRLSSSTSPSRPVPLPSSCEGLSPWTGNNPNDDGSEKQMNANKSLMITGSHAVLERHNLGLQSPMQVTRASSSSSSEGGQSIAINQVSSSKSNSHPVPLLSSSEALSPSIASNPKNDWSEKRMNAAAQCLMVTENHPVLERHDLGVQSPKQVTRAASASSCESEQSRAINRVSSSTSHSHPVPPPSNSKGLSPSLANNPNQDGFKKRRDAAIQRHMVTKRHAVERHHLDVQLPKPLNRAAESSSCESAQSRAINRITSSSSHCGQVSIHSNSFSSSTVTAPNHDASKKRKTQSDCGNLEVLSCNDRLPGAFAVEGIGGHHSNVIDNDTESEQSSHQQVAEEGSSASSSTFHVLTNAVLLEDEQRHLEEERRQHDELLHRTQERLNIALDALHRRNGTELQGEPILVEAQEVEIAETNSRKPRKTAAMVVILMLIAAAVVSLIAGLIIRDDGDQASIYPEILPTSSPSTSEHASPTLTPTKTITVKPITPFEQVRAAVLELFGAEAVQALDTVSTSPQARAARWVVEQDSTLWQYGDDDDEEEANTTQPVLRVSTVEMGIRFKQRYALVVLAYSTAVHQWKVSTQWLNGTVHECKWFGVYCNSLQQVTLLRFDGNFMAGTLPSELAGLAFLGELRITNSGGLRGTIPTELATLEPLKKLRLRELALTGTIPSGFNDKYNLQYLYLNGNHLNGTIPDRIGELKHLTYLYLYDNELTGSVPASLLSSMSLVELSLRNNGLLGSIPEDWFTSTARNNGVEQGVLERLNFSKNKLTGALPSQLIGVYQTKLQELILSDNYFTGSIPSTWGSLWQLQKLELYSNPELKDGVPPEVCLLRQPHGGENVTLTNFSIDCANFLSCPYACCTECYE